ncbi:MAG: HEAT repeat domain-containing protein [Planctomycetes bacterium]|nr:HEAT repeat domain-containing protein [Planctomycetota bacterium]
MITALCLSLALAVQSPTPAPADPKAIETAVAELSAAFGKDGTPAARAEAIQKHVGAVDGRVIELVAKGLADKEATVVTAAVDALGHMRHPSALDALQGYLRREKKKLADDTALLPQVFKAIGRHGSASSIDLLKDDPFDQRAYAAAQARIMSLGNIRATAAVEALVDLSKLVGPNRMDGLRNDFRVALAQLTGQDLGPESSAWQKWWQDNKKTFQVQKEAPKLDGILQRQWQRYWGLGEKPEGAGEGGRKRRDKGGESGGESGGGAGKRGG